MGELVNIIFGQRIVLCQRIIVVNSQATNSDWTMCSKLVGIHVSIKPNGRIFRPREVQ
jgi:hypothetical protein